MHLKTTHEVWNLLKVTREGTNQVKQAKIHLLVQQYESFKMKDGETIQEMNSRFTNIVNQLYTLGKTYTQKEQIMKVLRGLPKEWDAKATTIEEVRDMKNFKLEELIRKILSHEDKMNQDSKGESSKKGISLTVEDENKEESRSSSMSNEELSIIVKRLSEFGN